MTFWRLVELVKLIPLSSENLLFEVLGVPIPLPFQTFFQGLDSKVMLEHMLVILVPFRIPFGTPGGAPRSHFSLVFAVPAPGGAQDGSRGSPRGAQSHPKLIFVDLGRNSR